MKEHVVKGIDERAWKLILECEFKEIVPCSFLHFLFALLSGLLGYYLMWTICSRVYTARSRFRSPFWAGVFCALLSHWIIDSYTKLA